MLLWSSVVASITEGMSINHPQLHGEEAEEPSQHHIQLDRGFMNFPRKSPFLRYSLLSNERHGGKID